MTWQLLSHFLYLALYFHLSHWIFMLCVCFLSFSIRRKLVESFQLFFLSVLFLVQVSSFYFCVFCVLLVNRIEWVIATAKNVTGMDACLSPSRRRWLEDNRSIAFCMPTRSFYKNMKTIKLVIGKVEFTFFVCLLQAFISVALNLNSSLNRKAIIISPPSRNFYDQNVKFHFECSYILGEANP